MATSRWVTDFSICESCCWGFMWSAGGNEEEGTQRSKDEDEDEDKDVGSARYAVEVGKLRSSEAHILGRPTGGARALRGAHRRRRLFGHIVCV